MSVQAGHTPMAPSHLAEEALGLSVCPHPTAAPWDGPVLAEPARAARWLHETAGTFQASLLILKS